jgi:EAL and modified HD-GYP domain-containing signal transduction protein
MADRARKPGALMLHVGGDADAQPALVGETEFRQLCERFPCFFMEGAVPAALAGALQEAGCRSLTTDAVLRTDKLTAEIAPSVQFIGGGWFMAPPAKPTGNQAASRALALQLVQLVVDDADTHEIEAVLRRDPALSYHLLRLVNSLGMGMSKQITSFSQAILILGRAQLRRWLNLMLFSSRSDDERSPMLLARVAVRARAMELLAKVAGLDKSNQELAFMAGMFSLLGILFGAPLAEVLKPLKVSDALLAAVLRHEGELGQLLKTVETAEHCDPTALSALPALLAGLQVSHADFDLLTVQAYAWMRDITRDSGDTHA